MLVKYTRRDAQRHLMGLQDKQGRGGGVATFRYLIQSTFVGG